MSDEMLKGFVPETIAKASHAFDLPLPKHDLGDGFVVDLKKRQVRTVPFTVSRVEIDGGMTFTREEIEAAAANPTGTIATTFAEPHAVPSLDDVRGEMAEAWEAMQRLMQTPMLIIESRRSAGRTARRSSSMSVDGASILPDDVQRRHDPGPSRRLIAPPKRQAPSDDLSWRWPR